MEDLFSPGRLRERRAVQRFHDSKVLLPTLFFGLGAKNGNFLFTKFSGDNFDIVQLTK